MNSTQINQIIVAGGLRTAYSRAFATNLFDDTPCFVLSELSSIDDEDVFFSLVIGFEVEGFFIHVVKNLGTRFEEYVACLLDTDDFDKTVRYL